MVSINQPTVLAKTTLWALASFMLWAETATAGSPRSYELPMVADSIWLFTDTLGRYTLEYCPAEKHPKWVAWQLYAGFSEGTRTGGNPWRRDERIAETNNIDKGNKSTGAIDYRAQRLLTDTSATITYDRGHLCPSQDRTSDPRDPADPAMGREVNRRTFIYSNCSPQLPAFNQGIWEKLESCIARWGRVEGDTLYICAGGSITAPDGVALHTSPSGIAVPRHYFKAILRKRGADEWSAIGFWFEHRDWGRTRKDFLDNLDAIIVPVAEIERLTGLELFHTLPSEIRESIAKQKKRGDWDFAP